MIYTPPPLWYVWGIESQISDVAREVSAGQAALTVASRHDTPGDYFVAEARQSYDRKLFRVSETAGRWGCKQLDLRTW